MILTKKAIDAIVSKGTGIKSLLALELKCSEGTINRNIRDNEDNNDLTKIASIKIICEETGLNDSEILEEDTVSEPKN